MFHHSHICLAQGIVKSLKQNEIDRLTKQKFQKALDGLQVRPYRHGLYVKSLQSVGKKILEARVDQKERLLFDYHSRYCNVCDRNVPFIRIHEYISDHDDVIRHARRLNLEIDDSEFAKWEETKAEKIDICLELPEDYYRDFDIELTEEKFDDSEQWYAYDEKEFENLLGDPKRDLHLLITKEQAIYLKTSRVVILNGSAGSGKTTIGVYCLLDFAKKHPRSSVLYVTYNDHLLKYAVDLFTALGSEITITEQLGKPGVKFCTFRQLCCEIANEDRFKNGANELTFEHFQNWLHRFPLYGDIDPVQAWIEIRSVIRGTVAENQRANNQFLESDMLNLKEYLELGLKETGASFSSEAKRSMVYEIAQRYQKILVENNNFDEMLLTREAMRKIDHNQVDMVVADEIQDLTELQIELIIRLVSERNEAKTLFLTGDLQQVINPSSFRWENVRQLFHARGWKMPELQKLTRNFRCSGPIIQLANQLLDQRQKKIGRYGDESSPEVPVNLNGKYPVLCCIDENEFSDQLKQTELHGVDIIVQTEALRDDLKRQLGTTSVWTIEETKGLEFKDVILWSLTKNNGYSRFSEIEDENYEAKLNSTAAYEFNRFYVSITRARRMLVVFETTNDVYPWSICVKDNSLKLVGVNEIKTHLNAAWTPQDWMDRGKYFLENNKFDQAREAFHQIGDSKSVDQTIAHEFKSKGQFVDAAEIYEGIGFYKDAIQCWNDSGNYLNAARCCEKIEDISTAAEYYKKAKKYESEAHCYEILGEFAKAAKCYERCKEFQRAGDTWERVGDISNMVICWSKVKRFDLIASYFEEQKNYTEAANNWEKAGELEKAGKYWEMDKNFIEAGRVLQKLGNYHYAAEIYERIPDYELSAKMWEKDNDHANAALAWQHMNQYERAAHHWEIIKDWKKAANCWEQAGNYEEAANVWGKLGEDAKAAENWIRLENYTQAAIHWVRAKKYDKAAACWENVKRYEKAAVCMQLAKKWNLAACLWEKCERWKHSAICWEKFGSKQKAGKCWMKLDNIDRAIALGYIPEDLVEAVRFYPKKGDYFKSAESFKKMAQQTGRPEDWFTASDYYEKYGNKEELLFCLIEGLKLKSDLKILEKAGNIAKGLGHYKVARDCYQRAGDMPAVHRMDNKLHNQKKNGNPRA